MSGVHLSPAVVWREMAVFLGGCTVPDGNGALFRMMLISSRPLGIVNKKLKKDLERLSSGYRINRAGDGAAELAVSQSLRADIVELKCLKKNTKDGISLIQTAEGALGEIHDMLNRLIELSDQSANGTYADTDRASLQKEVEQLKGEVDRIAANTNFNGIYLFNGDFEPPVPPVFETVDDITGVTARPAVQKGASVEVSFDPTELRDGTTLTINGTVFEFDNDGVLNVTGAVPLDRITANIETAIKNTLGSSLDSCSLTAVGGNYVLQLEQADASAEDGKGISVSMGNAIPQVAHGTPVLGTIGSRQRLTIEDIDLSAIVDGTIIELFGIKYEVDYDGVTASGTTVLDMNAGTGSKVKRLQDQLTGQSNIAAKGTLRLAESTGMGRLTFTYNGTYSPGSSDIRFNTVPNTPPPALTVNDERKGINTPEVFAVQAARTDTIDCSRFQDGDTITVNGHVFELDADGTVGDPENILVDISGAAWPSDMAQALKAAFDAQGFPDMTLSIAVSGADQADLTVTSTAAADGEEISITYKAASAPEEQAEPGIYLQIGSGGLLLPLESMKTEALGIASVSVKTAFDAAAAVELLKQAVNQVSRSRGAFGAFHNRLEHTYQNLSTAHENLTASENRITSADMGEEMTAFTKHQIVAQAAQSMMAQAKDLMASKVQQFLQL